MPVEIEPVRNMASLHNRRYVLKRLVQTGLTGGGGLVALAGCNFSLQSPITIHWITNEAKWEAFKNLAEYFNRINQSGITVKAIPGTNHDVLVKQFQSQIGTYDLVSLDVTWMREFIINKWLKPLDEDWSNSSQIKRSDYLQKPLEICSWEGQLWAAPLHTDVGILYYRNDSPNNLIPSSKADTWTWDDLVGMATQAQESQWCSGGFLWEGYWISAQSESEGLMCTFLEILDGFGGQLFDRSDSPQRVLIKSAETIHALEHMKKWNSTISSYTIKKGPKKKATDSNGDNCANVWKEGNAAFMRNWPNYIIDSDNANNSKIAEKYNIAPLPLRVHSSPSQESADVTNRTRSCLGGWQIAINTYSSNKKAAWQFIEWMLAPEAQQYLAYNESFAVTLKDIYSDPHINARNPHYQFLPEIIDHAQYRPLLPNYLKDVAIPVQSIVSRVLTDDTYTSEQAVQDLEQQLKKALTR